MKTLEAITVVILAFGMLAVTFYCSMHRESLIALWGAAMTAVLGIMLTQLAGKD
ncbi:hypothetical protein ACRYI5_01000 [Furfurilactobacillus sp. WILCCON 0119]